MSTTKTKEELVRLSWITELRRQGDRQCYQAYRDDKMRVCALGLLREVALPADEIDFMDDILDIGALAGLDEPQSVEITYRNDGDEGFRKHTFAEIADVIAGWFPE